MRPLLAILCISGIAATPPSVAKEDRVAAIVAAAQYCRVGLPVEKSLSLLKAAGWKDVTPVMFGRSMAEVTGATALRRKKDSAMVGYPTGPAGQNCQFDFADVSTEARDATIARLDAQFGAHVDDAQNFITWHYNGNSISLGSRSPKTLTLLWLPAKEQGEAK
jgi:hypothetical protein